MDQIGIDISWTRRDFRTLNQIDNAAGTLQAGFPSSQSTEYRLTLTEDPSGTPDVLFSGAWDATGAASQVVTRTRILAENDGAVPAGGTPEQFLATIKKEIEVWRKIVREVGVKPE